MKQSPIPWYRWLSLALLPVALALFVWINYRLMTTIDYPNIDFSDFYTTGKLVLEGKSPYDPVAYQAGYDALGRTRYEPLLKASAYPLWSAYLFAPLGLFSYTWALTIWTIFNEICFILTFWLLLKLLLRDKTGPERQQAQKFLVITGIIFFLPSHIFINALLDGQTTYLTTLLITLFIYNLTNKHYGWAGLCLLFVPFKPTQFFLFLIPALLVLLPRERRRGLYVFGTACVVLVVAAFLIKPNWVGEWLAVRNEGWEFVQRMSTVWGLSSFLTGVVGLQAFFLVLGSAAILALCYGVWHFGRKYPALQANPVLFWGIIAALSIFVSIYTRSYERAVLFIPLMGLLEVVRRYSRRQKTLIYIGLALLFLILPWVFLPLKMPKDEISAGLFPVSVILFSWLALALNSSHLTSRNLRFNSLAKTVDEISMK